MVIGLTVRDGHPPFWVGVTANYCAFPLAFLRVQCLGTFVPKISVHRIYHKENLQMSKRFTFIRFDTSC
jgi:hypothetical protein